MRLAAQQRTKLFARAFSHQTPSADASNFYSTQQLRGSTQRINKCKQRFRKALRILQGLICKLRRVDLFGSTDAEEGALNTYSGQTDATSMKHVLIVGLCFFLVAAIITLVSLSLNLPNTAVEVALS